MSSANYRVRIFPESHVLEVQLSLSGLPPGPVQLQVPIWMPGAYGFMKYGRDLYDVSARTRSGASLQVTRSGWQGFRVEGAQGEVELTYRAYAYDPAWGELAGLVDHTHAVLIGTRYLFAQAHQGPVRVQYEVPAGWKLQHPAGAKAIDARTYEYPSFALFMDTPVSMGADLAIKTRDCEGTPLHFVFVDRAIGFEQQADAFVDEVVKMAAATKAMFGGFPFEHYTFVFTFNPTAGWGLEHATSTMIGLGEDALIDADERSRALRVCSHELFHAWNVCRLKPAPLARPDFANGSFTDGLWVAEGFTRYYEFLLLVRSGLIAPEILLSNVVQFYRHLSALPAYERVSARDSSIATFLNHNKYAGSVNNTIDYYDKGMLVAFDLDAHLRLAAKPSSLDREFRTFYEQFVGKGEGFTHEDVVRFFGERSPGAEELLRREVERGGGLSVPAMLERLGFAVKKASAPRIGVVLKKEGPEVENVLDGWAASRSGLAPGDTLLGIDDHVFSLKAFKWAIAQRESFVLEVKRGHRRFTVKVEPKPREEIVGLEWAGTEAQAEKVRAWLAPGKLELTPGRAIPLTSYENFHGVQSVL